MDENAHRSSKSMLNMNNNLISLFHNPMKKKKKESTHSRIQGSP